MKQIVTLGLFLIGLVISGCDFFGAKEDYYPITVGNRWNYAGTVIMETDVDAQPDTVQKMTAQVVVTRNDKLTSGADVFEQVSTVEVHQYYPFESSYVMVETSYVQRVDKLVLTYESKDDAQPDTTLSLPLVREKIWRVNEYSVARVRQQEDVTVPAGTYKNAWKIEQTVTEGGQSSIDYYWYADGIGPVKAYSQAAYGTISLTTNIELVSAVIK